MTDSTGWVYSETVKDHFLHPRNILLDEEEFQADGQGTEGNIQCGDEMTMWIKVDRDKKIITDCRWRTYGCASAIASTSILSERVKGMTLKEAYHLSPREISSALGGLPEHKIHCSVLGDKALRAAIEDYYTRAGLSDQITKKQARVICKCVNVTDHEIEEAVLEGARTYLELQERTKIGTVCGQCKEESLALLEEYKQKHF